VIVLTLIQLPFSLAGVKGSNKSNPRIEIKLNSLTPYSNALPENLIIICYARNLSPFKKRKAHYRVQKSRPLDTIIDQIDIVHILTPMGAFLISFTACYVSPISSFLI
jgi:hypothetical protein